MQAAAVEGVFEDTVHRFERVERMHMLLNARLAAADNQVSVCFQHFCIQNFLFLLYVFLLVQTRRRQLWQILMKRTESSKPHRGSKHSEGRIGAGIKPDLFSTADLVPGRIAPVL